jgi:hypothetical protein
LLISAFVIRACGFWTHRNLCARSPSRPAVVARFPAFLLVLAICRAPGQNTRSERGRKCLEG